MHFVNYVKRILTIPLTSSTITSKNSLPTHFFKVFMNIGELCSSRRNKPPSTSSIVAADKTLKGEGIKPGEWEKN